jgi:hypothetical protein
VSKAKAERRGNPSLREILDELVAHVRHLANDVKTMSQQDLDYAQERLEWLAEEVWRAAMLGRDRSG